MLIDLKLKGKTVLIFGGGIVGERKARKFLEANPRVIVVSKRFARGLERLGQQGKIKLIESNLESDHSLISSLISNSDVVVVTTGDGKLNKDIAVEAKNRKILVSVVDESSISDFYLPATVSFTERTPNNRLFLHRICNRLYTEIAKILKISHNCLRIFS